MNTPKIRVLIVEDSLVMQTLLREIISNDKALHVVGCVESGEEALQAIPQLKPDIVSMDIHLPGNDGISTTRQIMETMPLPIIIVSSTVSTGKQSLSIQALNAGALSLVEKPDGPGHPQFEKQAAQLCTQLRIMSQVKVIRLRSSKLTIAKPLTTRPSSHRYQVLGIVASTGGPHALSVLLNDLGPEFPLPILLVQHITASFLNGFRDWLSSTTPFQALEAQDGMKPLPGHIYLAPADTHLCYRRDHLALSHANLVSFQRPSGTVLLHSLAQELGAHSMGIVLTGMGDDGAAGLKAMRDAGAYTLAQDASSAVVYGMPGVAARLDAACAILPIEQMGRHLLERVMQ